MPIITIIGAGMMGSAMSIPAADNKNTVRLVGTPLDREIIEEARRSGYHKTLKRDLPEGVACYYPEEMEEALEDCDLIIGGVSSFGVEWFLENVLKKLTRNIPVLSITKGLHRLPDGSMITFPEYYHLSLGSNLLSLNCVGGPCISFELADRKHTEVAFCGAVMNDLIKIKKMLATDYYHITLTADIRGVETAVAMKNAYALGVSLAVGMAEAERGEGCREDYNPQAGLFFQAVKEISKLIALNGGGADKIALGAGDLYVTIFGGRTRRIGTLLGRGLSYSEAREMLSGVTLESVAIANLVTDAIRRLEGAGKANSADFPLLFHIRELLDGKPLCIPWKSFTD